MFLVLFALCSFAFADDDPMLGMSFPEDVVSGDTLPAKGGHFQATVTEDPDIYGSMLGIVSDEHRQVLLAKATDRIVGSKVAERDLR